MIVDLDDVVLTPSAEISKWNAVGNPIIYRMQRKDFLFDQINNNGGFVQFQINGVDLTGSFSNGSSLYVKSDNGVYNDFGLQTAEAFSGGNTLITTDIAYVSAGPGGFVNNNTLRPSYRLEVEVYNSDDEMLHDSAFSYSPSSTGALIIDVSSILRSNLSPDNDADLTAGTEVFIDAGVYLGFYIKYREVWTGSAESQTSDVANQFFAVLAARQIPSAYGGNMIEYAVIPDTVIILNQTDFSTGWANQGGGFPLEPWSIGVDLVAAIDAVPTERVRRSVNLEAGKQYSFRFTGTFDNTVGGVLFDFFMYLGGSQEVIIYEDLDPAPATFDKTVIATPLFDYTYIELFCDVVDVQVMTIESLLISEVPYFKFLTRLDRPVMWRGYSFLISAILETSDNLQISITSSIGDAIIGTGGLNNGILLFDINAMLTLSQAMETLTFQVRKDSDQSAITEQITIELRDPCENPILLVGRNSLGGPLEWMFDINQEYTFDYGNGRKAKRLVLTAVNLTINQWEALQDFITLGEVYRNNIVEFTSATIKTSTRIGQQLYIVDSDGNKIGVIAIPTKNKTRTKQIKHIFEIEIEYPEEFSV